MSTASNGANYSMSTSPQVVLAWAGRKSRREHESPVQPGSHAHVPVPVLPVTWCAWSVLPVWSALSAWPWPWPCVLLAPALRRDPTHTPFPLHCCSSGASGEVMQARLGVGSTKPRTRATVHAVRHGKLLGWADAGMIDYSAGTQHLYLYIRTCIDPGDGSRH